jgi:quercetin dioxygenase-like cupin family protein
MRWYPFETATAAPVTHDPELTKHILMDERISCIRRISRIALNPGYTVSQHSHTDDNELFYCIRGRITVSVDEEPVFMKDGDVLVIEPGEAHAVTGIAEPTELLYMRVAAK